MGGACSTTRGDRVLVGKPEGRGPPGRPRRRWENSTKIDFQEMIQFRENELDWPGREVGQMTGCCQCGSESPGSVQCGKLLHQLRTC
jgi:hypothetical protein